MRSLIFAICLAVPAPLFAQDAPLPEDAEEPIGAPGDLQIGASASLLSDYRFRGVSRSDQDPAVQASITASLSGFYAELRATSLSGTDRFRLRDPAFGDLGDAQFEAIAGFGAPIGGGFQADAGITWFAFAGGQNAGDYAEPYASLSYLIGPLNTSVGARYASAQDAIGDEPMLYVFGQADFTVPFKPWTISATLGHQSWGDFGSYWTWSLGAERQIVVPGAGDASLGLAYVDAGLDGPGADATLVASLRLFF